MAAAAVRPYHGFWRFVHLFPPAFVPRSSLVRLVKYAGEAVLARLPSRVASGSSLILAYHNIVLPEDVGRGDASLHLSVVEFRKQLAIAKQEADVVSLPTLLAEHGRPGRRIAVTFDDAYAGCLRHGLPACRDEGIEPTIFVAPGLLGLFAPWDLRAQRGAWSASDRQHFLNEQRGVAAEHANADGEGLPDDYRIGTLEELQFAASTLSFQIGNHTMRHVNLGVLTAQEIRDELMAAEDFLTAEFPSRMIPQLAYPYGISPRRGQIGEHEEPGHNGLLVTGAWIKGGQESTGRYLPRLNIPMGLTTSRFASKLRGWVAVE